MKYFEFTKDGKKVEIKREEVLNICGSEPLRAIEKAMRQLKESAKLGFSGRVFMIEGELTDGW